MVALRVRPWCAIGAMVLAVLGVLPPLVTLARRYEVAQAFQFSLFALAVPALLVVGAPWARLGLVRPFDRLAASRRRHPELLRGVGFLTLDVGVMALWRSAAVVDGLVAHGWLVVVEAVSLIGCGAALWLELVESPPLAPRLPPLRRGLVAALAMWSVWIMAYLVGLSRASWYHSFPHRLGGLSTAADQQLATAVLWFAAAVAFMPVIFWNLVSWLRSDEDADDELRQLVRSDRRFSR
jgi:cytochrome c oxidase assembly factor CtaG